MRSGSRPGVGNKRMIGQLSKAMDRSNETSLHRVRPQQGTERINTHGRQTPKGPRSDPPRGPRMQPNGRPMGGQNANMANGGMMQMTPQQQMQLMAMFEQQAQMMAQIMPPQMQGMVQPAINPAFQNGGGQPQGRSLFDRVEGNPHRPNAYNPRNGNTFSSPENLKPQMATTRWATMIYPHRWKSKAPNPTKIRTRQSASSTSNVPRRTVHLLTNLRLPQSAQLLMLTTPVPLERPARTRNVLAAIRHPSKELRMLQSKTANSSPIVPTQHVHSDIRLCRCARTGPIATGKDASLHT